MLSASEILDEIRRHFDETGRVPGLASFVSSHPGLPSTAFKGFYWATWNDAVRAAGLSPRQPTAATDEDVLFRALAELTRELGHFPTQPEMRRSHRDGTFSIGSSAMANIGTKQQQMERLRFWCERRADFADVAKLCSDPLADLAELEGAAVKAGYVYLFHSPTRGYKIGLTRSTPRRWFEIQQEDPEEVELVHHFRTVDPEGIEAYWHRRFDAQRKDRGEWFALSRGQVAEFKRRSKSM